MDAIEFIQKWPDYLNEIRAVIKPELIPILEEVANTDPHDLVRPDSWFPSESVARGYVWSMFVRSKTKFEDRF
jgi:L-fucose mutarotase/ribose pyranase (RbsD/FucU family)